jgi:hypothetical protein
MMRSLALRWLISLALVVLLLPACDNTDDAASDTTRATTTTTAAPTTTTGIEPFDFATQIPCDWFSPEEIDAIVTSTYEALGVPLDRTDEMDQTQGSWSRSSCYWAEPVVSLSAVDGAFEGDGGTGDLISGELKPHPALDNSVRVSNLTQGVYSFGLEGVAAVLKVDGHAEFLQFVHGTNGLGDDVKTINTLGLTIANEMLQQMGWIESP